MTEQEEQSLRTEIGRVLNPGPWKHEWVFCTSDGMRSGIPDLCHKCRLAYCRQRKNAKCEKPDPWTGSFADAAERLVKMCNCNSLIEAVRRHWEHTGGVEWTDVQSVYAWLLFDATPADRCRVCLRALAEKRERS